MIEEAALPDELLARALISAGGEHAWQLADVPRVIEAARSAGLANLGGQPQFLGPIGTAEPYWLNFDPADRQDAESWQQYVDRTAAETLDAFQRLCAETDFEQEGVRHWQHIRAAREQGVNVTEHLWFVLYFERSD